MKNSQVEPNDILTSYAGLGELILQSMRPGMGPSIGIAVWVSNWIAFGTSIVNDLLSPEHAAQFESSIQYGDKTSETYPLPERIPELHIGDWRSVAWRIDQLREWANQT